MAGQLLQTVAHQGTSSIWSVGLDCAAGLEVGEFGTGELGMGDEPVEQMVGVGAFQAFEQKQASLFIRFVATTVDRKRRNLPAPFVR
ncbi:hypothetical protein HUT06_03360 [Actinomadura sp. NAK00032]|uniref:hypothetical protein n=1 Tax=Actinomadura sp. NAK00032 TaxID=2742128 RepID=UPI0015909B0C|nr:hypothetical protein [Actinomadura sp. NAK00032]QKW33194.1 hypothetical protein HUT06_03360 [Actinomadura sp. NAK00032]